MTHTHAQLALSQIQSARDYTRSLLADIDDDQWFQCPPGWTSHLAWQVGHLAMAEYGLALFRQRGRAEIDKELMPSAFRKKFGRGSQPELDPQAQPSPVELLRTLDRVHDQVAEEVPAFTDAELDTGVDMPYAAYPTRFGALLFCAHHEMLHAGQIGALRRLLGKDPVR